MTTCVLLRTLGIESKESSSCSGDVPNLLCIYIYKGYTDIHLFPRMLCGLELGICFSFCYVCIDVYVELLIDFTFVNILYLCNNCLFTQAMVITGGHGP